MTYIVHRKKRRAVSQHAQTCATLANHMHICQAPVSAKRARLRTAASVMSQRGDISFPIHPLRPCGFHPRRVTESGPDLREKRSWRSEGLQLHLVFVRCRLTRGGRARGKRSTSINSSYITSLCWCQVAEWKERKESALTLFFSIVRPQLTLLQLCLMSLRVRLHGYRRVPCLPNATGGSLRFWFLFASLTPLSFPLTIAAFYPLSTIFVFIRGMPPSFLLRWTGPSIRLYSGVWTSYAGSHHLSFFFLY